MFGSKAACVRGGLFGSTAVGCQWLCLASAQSVRDHDHDWLQACDQKSCCAGASP